MRALVFGSGSWGTALAQVLADNGHEVTVWGRNPSELADLRAGRNSRYFGDTPVTDRLAVAPSLSALTGRFDLLLISVPSRAFPEIYQLVEPFLWEGALLVNAAKGFEPKTGKRLSVALSDAFAEHAFRGPVSLIGPSHAEEVVRRMPTSIVAVSGDVLAAKDVQHAFSCDYLRVYVAADTVGAEYGVAIKNVIALASGMLTGLGYGDNAKAALITRGLVETVRYGEAKGGCRETFFGLAGVGDLIVTCFSPHSRNYRAGLLVGKADSAEALKDVDFTVEGLESCRTVAEDAKRSGIEMPIVEGVYDVLFGGTAPSEVLKRLMRRPLRAE